MSQKIVYLKSLLMAFIMLPVVAMAQYTSLDTKLATISDEMFANGNDNFIIVDAIRDGIIAPESTYNFTYLEGGFTFNQLALSKKFTTIYESKMKKFFDQFNNGHDYFLSIIGSKASMKDILNDESTFRKGNRIDKALQKAKTSENVPTDTKTYTVNTKTVSTDGIIKAMIEDGLIVNKHNYAVKWNMEGIHVNGKKLKGDVAEKYKTMFENQAGFKPTKGGDGIVITATP